MDSVTDDYDYAITKDGENSNGVMIDDKNNDVPEMDKNVVLEDKLKDNNNKDDVLVTSK